MPAIARINDIIATGHGCDSVAPIKQGSTNVFVNGLGAVRVGDSDTHNIPVILPGPPPVTVCLPHTVIVGSGSGSVFINGKGVARVGDTFSGEPIASGSLNVFAG